MVEKQYQGKSKKMTRESIANKLKNIKLKY